MNNQTQIPELPTRVSRDTLFTLSKLCKHCKSTMRRKYLIFGKAICDNKECFIHYETCPLPSFLNPPPPPEPKPKYEYRIFILGRLVVAKGIELAKEDGWEVETECDTRSIDDGERIAVLMKRIIK